VDIVVELHRVTLAHHRQIDCGPVLKSAHQADRLGRILKRPAVDRGEHVAVLEAKSSNTDPASMSDRANPLVVPCAMLGTARICVISSAECLIAFASSSRLRE